MSKGGLVAGFIAAALIAEHALPGTLI